jgi:hypothetical protein
MEPALNMDASSGKENADGGNPVTGAADGLLLLHRVSASPLKPAGMRALPVRIQNRNAPTCAAILRRHLGKQDTRPQMF